MKVYPMNHKSIAHKIKIVHKEFLKFDKTHRDRRKQTWYHKAQNEEKFGCTNI